jgi:uncharacterized protein (DUF1501 family)
MLLNRRCFLRAGAVGMTAFLLPRRFMRRAHAGATDPVLVAFYLRGGADPLTVCVPTFDPTYYAVRPTIQVPPGTELPLVDGFGLHPAFAPILPLFQSGELAIIHLSGSPDPSRSHFDSQDFMERAAPGNKSVVTGWLNRYLSIAGGGAAIAGITLQRKKDKSLLGPAPSLAFSSIADFALLGNAVPERRGALEVRYELLPETLLGGAVNDALDAIDVVATVDTSTSIVYPATPIGDVLKDAAALVKADIGLRVLAVDLEGWDHHSAQLTRITALGGELSDALAAFHQDLGARAATTLTLCMTEFGRRVAENGGDGSDHGHGGIMLALGGGISGGRVILRDDDWPGLEPQNLYGGQDLPVTTDFRDIFAEALNRHLLLNVSQMGSIFPGFSVSTSNFPGLYA